jgi:uncharacterized protein
MVGVYLKPTNFCSVGCEHCYLDKALKADKTVMSPETLEQTAQFVRDFADSFWEKDPVQIIFHGGEPLMMSGTWLENACEVLEKTLPNCRFAIQTSLMPLKEEHIAFLKKRTPYAIGSSLDWTFRTIQGSAASYRDVYMKRVEFLRQHGLPTAVTLVAAKEDLPHAKEIVRWFFEHHLMTVQFERFIDESNSSIHLPSNLEHSLFLKDVFCEVMRLFEEKGEFMNVRIFRDVLSGVLDGRPCGIYGGACQSHLITVEPDGKVGLCPNRASYDAPCGSVQEGFEAFKHSKARLHWILRQHLQNESDACFKCPYAFWCKGACPISPEKVSVSPDEDCGGHRVFIDFVADFAQKKQKTATEYLQACLTGKRNLPHC